MKYVRVWGCGEFHEVAISNKVAAEMVRAGYPAEIMRDAPEEGLGVESYALYTANQGGFVLGPSH